MKRSRVLFAGLLVLVSTPHVTRGQEKARPKLTDVAWLTGQWRSGPQEKTASEEHWSEPAGGAMMGMFRLLPAGKPGLYEFLLLEEEADGVFMRLRHYRPRMEDLEKTPIRLKLTEATDRRLVFENPDNDKPKRIVYLREAPDRLAVTVETVRDGKPAQFTLRMGRSK